MNEWRSSLTCSFLSSGLLWELWPLLHCTEPAAPTHRSSLHPSATAGLAYPHRHEVGAADVHEQVYLKCTQPAFSSFPCQPAACQKGDVDLALKNPSCNFVMTFISLTCVCLSWHSKKTKSGQVDMFGVLWCTISLFKVCINSLF